MRSKLPSVAATALAVAFTCAGCAGPVNRSGPLPGSQRTDNALVTSEEGPFQFTGIAIRQSYPSANVTGRVTNNTPKQWSTARFQMTVFDGAGRNIGSSHLVLTDFLPGQTQLIEAGAPGGYQAIRLDEDRNIRSFDLKFLDGEFKARYVFSMTRPVAATNMVFGDDSIEIRFVPAQKQIGFMLHNRGSLPAKIDWNSAAFVDIAGGSHKVMHDGVKFINRNNLQAPTVIPPGARISDFVYPTDYVTNFYGEWLEAPLFPDAPKANAFKGRSFGVFLPIEIDGKVKNYNFVFRVNDVIS